jgi:DNA topoisomerase-6 subunit B
LPADEPSRVIRFANRVPLLFQQSACSSFKAVVDTNWRNYDLSQPRDGLPVGPLVVMIHMASVWVPFTSESKEAVADYDEIRKEMKLALMECGRKLGTYLRKRAQSRREAERRDVFERYIGEISQAVEAINGTPAKKLYDLLLAQAKKRTAIADRKLDEEGKTVRDNPEDMDGVLIVDGNRPPSGGGAGAAPAEPPLLDVRPVGRLSAKGKPSPEPEKPAPKKPKPRMVIRNGRLTPVGEEAALFTS